MVTIDWPTGVISVPQSYLSSLGGGIYELDVDQFRLDLKALEDDSDGIMWPPTHIHNTQVTLSGVTYARTVEIINGYTIEFEDTGTPYTVKCVGANHNIGDVKVVNNVSLLIGNSAGLIVGTSGVGDPWAANLSSYNTDGTAGKELKKKLDFVKFLGTK